MPQGGDEALFTIRNRDVSGGVNTRFFATDIAEDQAQQLTNMDTSTPGIRVTRPGTLLACTGMSWGPPLALAEFQPTTGNTVLLAVSPGGSSLDHSRLWKWDGTGNWQHVGRLTGYTGGAARDYNIVAGYSASVTSGTNHIAIISHDAPGVARWIWDGTNALRQAAWGGASNPNGQVMAYSLGRMAVLGSSNSRRSAVYFSVYSVLDGSSSFPSGNILNLGGNSKGDIVAIETFRESATMVFLSDSLETLTQATNALSGATTWGRSVIHAAIGCSSRLSVANAGEDIYFADQYSNIRSLQRTIADFGKGVASLPVSDPIKSWIDRVNPLARSRLVCAAFDRFLLVGLPIDSATEASHVFVLDVAKSSQRGQPCWDGPWTGAAFTPYCMSQAVLPGATLAADRDPALYVASNTTANGGLVYKLFRGNADDGSVIGIQETTKRHNNGTLELDKTWTRVSVFAVAASTTLMVEASLDGQAWETVGYADLSGEGTVLPQELPFSLSGAGVVKRTFALDTLSDNLATDLALRMTATMADDVSILGYSLFGHMENWDRSPKDRS